MNDRIGDGGDDGGCAHNAYPRDAPEPLARLVRAMLDNDRLSIDPIIVCTARQVNSWLGALSNRIEFPAYSITSWVQ